MAKKKKHHRKKSVYKQRQRPTQSSSQPAATTDQAEIKSTTQASVTPQATVAKPSPKPQAMGSDIDAKRSVREVRHSLILAGSIFIGLAVLWALFAYTKLGPAIYTTFKF